MNQYLYRTPPYDPINDFTPITLVAKTMVLMMVNAASDVKTVGDLIGKARQQPGKLNFGAGTISTKLLGHLFNKAAGVDTVLVPYNGSAEVTQGLLTKSVDFTLRRHLGRGVADPERAIPRAGQVRRPAVPAGAKCADGPGDGAKPRSDHGLARARRAQGHSARDRRQAPAGVAKALADPDHQGARRMPPACFPRPARRPSSPPSSRPRRTGGRRSWPTAA